MTFSQPVQMPRAILIMFNIGNMQRAIATTIMIITERFVTHVMLQCQLSIGALDLFILGILLHSQNLVRIVRSALLLLLIAAPLSMIVIVTVITTTTTLLPLTLLLPPRALLVLALSLSLMLVLCRGGRREQR